MTNISSYQLSPDELQLLNRGMSFIPTPVPAQRTAETVFNDALSDMNRKMQIRHYFEISYNPASGTDPNPSTSLMEHVFHGLKPPSQWPPPTQSQRVLTFVSTLQQDLQQLPSTNRDNNLTRGERQALRTLKNHPQIIVKPTDKGGGVCVVERQDYEQALQKMLDDPETYRPATFDQHTHSEIARERDQLLGSHLFSTTTRKWVIGHKTNDQPSSFYGLPKVHKLDLTKPVEQLRKEVKYRPITAAHSYVTAPLSRWLDALLQPLVQRLNTTIKDTLSFVQAVENLRIPTQHHNTCAFLTADITSLYTRIPTVDGLKRMRNFLNRPTVTAYLQRLWPGKPVALTIALIMRCFSLVLNNNYVEFNGKTYKQISGTAMGQPCAVVYAVIYVFELEQSLVQTARENGTLLVYYRYIDDVFAILNSKTSAEQFATALNQLHPPHIEFTSTTSMTEGVFLDTTTYKGPRLTHSNQLDIRTYQKPTNTYMYLPASSSHPPSTIAGWIRGEMTRYIRCHSQHSEYTLQKRRFYERLLRRGYTPTQLKRIMNNVFYSNRTSLLKPKEKQQQQNSMVFTPIFNPSLSATTLKATLARHWSQLIQQDDRWIEATSHEAPKIAYKTTPNLQQLIVRSKYTPPGPSGHQPARSERSEL